MDENTPVTIAANKDITLDLGGNTVNVSLGDTKKTFITTQANSTLTVKNGTFQGNNDGRAFDISGELRTQELTITKFTSSDSGGAVKLTGKATFANTTFSHNRSEYQGVDRYGGGAIYLPAGSASSPYTFAIDRCTFEDNFAAGCGGAIHMDFNATGSITNSKFLRNESYVNGGAINANFPGSVTLEGNVFDANKATYVSTNPYETYDGLTNNTRIGYGGAMRLNALNHPSPSYPGPSNIILRDNTITNNRADGRGGGISLVNNQFGDKSNCITIESGLFEGNSASIGGAIDYTQHGQAPLKLPNTLVTSNKAPRGGGVWICPDGSLNFYATLSGSIQGNTAEGGPVVGLGLPNQLDAAGSDIIKEGRRSKDLAGPEGGVWGRVDVAERDSFGKPIYWYKDEADARYQDGDEVADPSYYRATSYSFALHRGEPFTDKAEDDYTIVIKNNTADTRGGGIATNSPIQMGEDADTSLDGVKKAWTTDPHPASAQFNLYREANGERELVETVTLNAANNWEYHFASLPTYSIDSNGVRTDYTWSFEEAPMTGWAATQVLNIHQWIDVEEGTNEDPRYFHEDYTENEFSILVISGTAEPNTTKKFAFYVSDNGGDPYLYHEPWANKDAEFTVQTDASGNWKVDGSRVPLWAAELDEDGYEVLDEEGDWTPITERTYTFMEWDEDAEEYVPVFTHDYQWGDDSKWGTRDYTMVFNAPVAPIEETLPITKKIEGNPPASETFTFTIKAASEGAPMPANTQATTKGAGTANFGPIKFEQAGTYVYTVTETAETAEGYTYDPSTYTVTYKVTLDGTKLSATRTITKDGDALPQDTESLEFTNIYTPAPAQATIPVTKTITGAEPESPETFTFELSAEDENTPLPEDTRVEITGPGEGEFGSITFEKPGKYTYEVKEEPGTAAGYTYDDTVYTVELDVYEENGALTCAKPIIHEGESPVTEIVFNNTYTIESTTVAGLQVAKTVEGETPAADAEFVFVLEPAEGEDTNPMPDEANEGPSQLISVIGAGTEYFGDITFEKAGTYHYTVREINTEAAGYTYDNTVYTVTYTVVANHETAQLEASATYEPAATRGENGEDALAFTNAYAHVPNTADGIKVRKHVSGDEPEHALDFTFELRPNEANNPMPGGVEEGTVSLTIHGAEEEAFKPIHFEEPGTYSYTIVETGEAPTGYTFDPAVYVVTYHVTPGEEELGIEYTITKDDADLPQDTEGLEFTLEFTNTFTHTPTQVVIPVTKTITGAEPTTVETVAFVLSAEDEGAPLPERARIEITGPGEGEFGPITFEQPGTYTYEIEEVPGTATGYTYDNSVHEVTVTVEEQNGVLQAELSYACDGQQAKGVAFENKYTAPSTPVDVVLVKHLLNARINKGEFSFGLYDEAGERHGEIIHTVLEGTLTRPDTDKFTSYVEIAFEDLIYSEPGEYFYSIREHMDGTTEVVEGDEWNQAGFEPGFYKGGVKYDDKEYPVVVTVLENEEGKLEASVAYPGSSNAVELVNEYNEEYIEIDDNDEHRNNGLHEEPEEPDTPTPQPKPKPDPKPNPGPSPEPKVDTPTTAAPTPQATPKAGSARTEDTNPVAPLAVLALLASGTAGFAFARCRRSKN